MIGFCNGLAVVIGLAQLHPFQVSVCMGNATLDDPDYDGGHRRRLSSGPCTDSGFKEGAEMWWMLLIMLSSMLVMEFLPQVCQTRALHVCTHPMSTVQKLPERRRQPERIWSTSPEHHTLAALRPRARVTPQLSE